MGGRRGRGRGSSSRMDLKIPMFAGLIIVIVLFFMYLGVQYGFSVSATADYIAIVPAFIFLGAGMYLVVEIGGLYAFPALTMIGVGMAILLTTMYDRGFVTVQMMSGMSIVQVSFWCVVIAGLAGIVVASLTSRK
jgi:hypothetical protein